jgi:hypothetical protein
MPFNLSVAGVSKISGFQNMWRISRRTDNTRISASQHTASYILLVTYCCNIMQILHSEFNLNIFRHDYRGIYDCDKKELW